MKYFGQIYNAAKSDDKKALELLFEKGVCVDIHEDSEDFNTPAGKLAKEGNFKAAFYLMNYFGANPWFIVQGLLQGKFTDEAKELAKDFDIDPALVVMPKILESYQKIREYAYNTESDKSDLSLKVDEYHHARVIAGDVNIHDYNHTIGFNKSLFRNNAMRGGHLYLVEQIYNKSGMLKKKKLPSILSMFNDYGGGSNITGRSSIRLQSEKLALFSLSFIKNSEFLSAILKKMIKHQSDWCENFPKYDIQAVMKKAKQIQYVMNHNKSFGYREAYDYCQANEVSVSPLLKRNLPFFSSVTSVRVVRSEITRLEIKKDKTSYTKKR